MANIFNAIYNKILDIVLYFFGKDDRERFFYATKKGYVSPVKRLIDRGTDVNVKDDKSYGQTALHYAAGKGYVKVAELLINERANVNERNSEGWTPLHYVTAKGDMEMVELLINAEANVNARTDLGCSPLYFAVMSATARRL